MRSLQAVKLPPDVEAECGLLVLPSGAMVVDTTSARRELMRRHKDGFGYEGYNGEVIFDTDDDVTTTERYGYPSDDYSEESMP